jgi:hypothetical protein
LRKEKKYAEEERDMFLADVIDIIKDNITL